MKLPIGIANFKKLIHGEYKFIDKSLFIKDIVENGSEVILITRPRRFGKTMNMSMLYYFFNNAEDSLKLFNNLQINQYKNILAKYNNKYPTIFITLKDTKLTNYEDAISEIAFIMSEAYRNSRTSDLLKTLDQDEIGFFEKIINKKASINELRKSLSKLTEFLNRLYNKGTIILIDEYDTPVHSAYNNEYYNEMMDFLRSFLGAALKDNTNLYKAIITGITKVAQESIYSGLNNFRAYSVLDDEYAEYFGFTDHEVKDLLSELNVSPYHDKIKLWYNGYSIHNKILYNPWSILNCLNGNVDFKPYWVNTSDNEIIKTLVSQSKPAIKDAMIYLVQGNSVEQAISENLVFKELDKNEGAIWALLLYSGYLNAVLIERKDGVLYAKLSIPNKEVMFVYDSIISSWFSDISSLNSYKTFVQSLMDGNLEVFENILSDYISSSGSYFDFNSKTKEQVFHSLILGLVLGLRDDYTIKSNHESGYGRFDVVLIPRNKNKLGIIIELKTSDKESKLPKAAKQALKQIEDKKYNNVFIGQGIDKVLLIGLAFSGKKLNLTSKYA